MIQNIIYLKLPPNSNIYTTDDLYYINTKTFVNTKSKHYKCINKANRGVYLKCTAATLAPRPFLIFHATLHLIYQEQHGAPSDNHAQSWLVAVI